MPGRRARASSEDVPLAPVYQVPDQEIYAVEHPMIVQNLDKALKTFGTNRPFRRILDSGDPEECLPLYLRPGDPLCTPILSVNTDTTNVVLQITVPKRTGRKRKRGSQDPYILDANERPLPNGNELASESEMMASSSVRNDDPVRLRRSLQDNVGNFTWKAIGKIKHTHRYRGLSDFQQATSHEKFISNMKETFLRGQIPDLNEFKFDLKMGYEHLTEIIPPPAFTNHCVPFNWAWQQNPHIYVQTDAETGMNKLINTSANTSHTAKYLPRDSATIPTRGPVTVPSETALTTLLVALKDAFEERPLWTRRGLMNRLGHMPSFYLLRTALPYIGYMFKGGPFRDAVIKYGVDPRSDPKYRMYQTFFFKVFSADDNKEAGDTWEDLRTTNRIPRIGDVALADTHHFDGVNLTLDGKVWQVCDISDPFLKNLIETAPLRETCDRNVDGWFTNGRLAKIKAIMKVKLIAIRTGRTVTEEDFLDALSMPDIVPGRTHRNIHIPVPDLRLSDEEVKELQEKGVDLKSLGITLLRKKENQGNLHAKRARGAEKTSKRGKYQRKEKKALIESGVDNTLAVLKERKDKRNLASKNSRDKAKATSDLKGSITAGNTATSKVTAWADGVVETNQSVMDSVEANADRQDHVDLDNDDEGNRSDARSEDNEEEDEEDGNGDGDDDSEGTDDVDFQHMQRSPGGVGLPPSSGFRS